MANIDAPFGLRPVKNLDGTPFTGGTMKATFLVGDGTACYIGDLVTLDGSAGAEGYPSVQQGAAADAKGFLGVVTSFEPDPSDLSTQYRKASTLRNCNVVLSNTALFAIQTDGTGAITDVGETADIVITHTPSTQSGISAMELKESDVGTGLNLLILGIEETPDNEVGASCNFIVKINETPFNGGDIGA